MGIEQLHHCSGREEIRKNLKALALMKAVIWDQLHVSARTLSMLQTI